VTLSILREPSLRPAPPFLQDLPTAPSATARIPDMLPGKAQAALPQLLMFYRRDVLEDQLSHAPPATWEDLADWARVVNGTVDANGDGRPDYALCLDLAPMCTVGYLAYAMAASYVQPHTRLGTFFHPPNMSVLMNNAGYVRVLDVIRCARPRSAAGALDLRLAL
jgi:hypothetical protein